MRTKIQLYKNPSIALLETYYQLCSSGSAPTLGRASREEGSGVKLGQFSGPRSVAPSVL